VRQQIDNRIQAAYFITMKIRNQNDLEVYQLAFKMAMEIYEISKAFPKAETYALTDQIRRSSRSVCANIAEAFGKRKYSKSFVAKLVDALAETHETITWLDFGIACNYIKSDISQLKEQYSFIKGKLIIMISRPEQWTY
jgi:four helix bundle protein